MNKAYLLTGGNVGNRKEYLEKSAGHIAMDCGKIVKKSALYETAAWGKTNQAAFLNQALELHTPFSVVDLMLQLLIIEERLGRKRMEKYGPRIIDIDILLFNHEIINSATVTIPHPELINRRFALVPLEELTAHYIHPVAGKSIHRLLQICPDPLPVKKFSGP
jgi:2-amino-4-hydroxy-6-hydroxymethyldihydropteridine diphosphokinase